MQARWKMLPGTLLAALCVLLATDPASAQANASPHESALLAMANQARTEHRLPPLEWDPALARAAKAHAEWVAHEPGELLHEYPGEPDLVARASRQGAHFGMIAENLARGGRLPAELHAIWMRTPVHRANILDARMNAVGIGVVERGGILYAVEDFGRSVPAPTQNAVEEQVMAALRRSGLPSAQVTDAARRSCSLGGDAPAGARLVVQWDGSYPGDLPDALLRQIARNIYEKAAVGACPSREVHRGFTTYRVAVLLY